MSLLFFCFPMIYVCIWKIKRVKESNKRQCIGPLKISPTDNFDVSIIHIQSCKSNFHGKFRKYFSRRGSENIFYRHQWILLFCYKKQGRYYFGLLLNGFLNSMEFVVQKKQRWISMYATSFHGSRTKISGECSMDSMGSTTTVLLCTVCAPMSSILHVIQSI